MPAIRNYDGVQHGEFRRTFDPTYVAAHDALDDAYYGPEPNGGGRRSSGWRDGVDRTLLLGQRGVRLRAGVLERSTNGGQTWSAINGLTPKEVFERLQEYISKKYEANFAATLDLVGTDDSEATADGFTAARRAALVSAMTAQVYADFDTAYSSWKASQASAFTIGPITLNYSAGPPQKITRQINGGGVQNLSGTAAEAGKRVMRVMKWAKEKAIMQARAAINATSLAQLESDGWTLDL